MPADQFQRLNLDLIYPPFLERALEVAGRLRKRGLRFVATSGFRGPREQLKLWRQGRFEPGPIVTNAPWGFSQHNFGLAVDFVYDLNPATPRVEPSWDAKLYQPLVTELLRAGLHSGISYKDAPHVGWPRHISGAELAPLRKIWQETPASDDLTCLKAVWKYLDTQPQLGEYPEVKWTPSRF